MGWCGGREKKWQQRWYTPPAKAKPYLERTVSCMSGGHTSSSLHSTHPKIRTPLFSYINTNDIKRKQNKFHLVLRWIKRVPPCEGCISCFAYLPTYQLFVSPPRDGNGQAFIALTSVENSILIQLGWYRLSVLIFNTWAVRNWSYQMLPSIDFDTSMVAVRTRATEYGWKLTRWVDLFR